MRNLVLFGAGASYGSGGVSPEAPPLGDDLFSELQKHCETWSRLPDDIALFFRTKGFEFAMNKIRYEESTTLYIPALLREMARYFLRFNILDDNEYIKFYKKMRDFSKTAVATLNYDILIEQACVQMLKLGLSYDLASAPDHDVPIIIKVHGSPNFLPSSSNITMRGNIIGGGFTSVFDFPVKPLLPQQAVDRLESYNTTLDDTIQPVMAMYTPDKATIFCGTFVKKVQKDYVTIAKSCETMHIVGVRCVPDMHIWGPIAEGKSKIFFYNRNHQDIDQFMDWAKRVGAVRRVTCVEGYMSDFVDHFDEDI